MELSIGDSVVSLLSKITDQERLFLEEEVASLERTLHLKRWLLVQINEQLGPTVPKKVEISVPPSRPETVISPPSCEAPGNGFQVDRQAARAKSNTPPRLTRHEAHLRRVEVASLLGEQSLTLDEILTQLPGIAKSKERMYGILYSSVYFCQASEGRWRLSEAGFDLLREMEERQKVLQEV